MASRLWGDLAARDTRPADYRSTLLAVLIATFLLRFGLAVCSPNIHQADEIYQAAEQANLAVHGYGIESWEFREAARSALYPTLVTPAFWLNVDASTRQSLIAAWLSLLSLIPVAIAFHWAGRTHGIRGGVIAAVMMGTWFELVYFAPKPTADAVSGYVFLAALFFASPTAGRGGVALAAACLALTLGLRMQIAPAVGVAMLATLAIDWRRRAVPVIAGAAAGVLLVGIVEWLWWGTPFLGHVNYLRMEFVHRVSNHFGREPLTFFAKNYVLIYGAALPIVALLTWIGAKRAPILLIAAVALVIPFHFVAHKEYRFLVVALPVVVMLMGLAAADLVSRFPSLATNRALGVAAVTWLLAMIALSLGESYRPFWIRDRNHIWAFHEIGGRPDACGVALVGIRWFHTPGYSGLGRDIPIYETGRDPLNPAIAAAANYVLVGHKAPIPADPYVRVRTYARPEEHLYQRPGACVPDPAARIVSPDPIPGGG